MTAAGALGQQRLLDRLKPACARILREDRTLLGSGFLVAKDLVATCHHVISEENANRLVCRFGDVDPVERTGKVLRWDCVRDTALIRLEAPAPADPLLLGGDASDLAWYAFGFPAFAEPVGTPFFGRVLDAHAVDKDGRPACSLQVEQFGGRVPESVGGISGTAVVSEGRVIGTVFRVLGSKDGWQQPNFGLCYATPVWTLRALLDAAGEGDVSTVIQAPVSRAPSAAEERAFVARWEGGAVSLEAIRLAGDVAQVQQALADYARSGLGGHQAILVAAEVLVGMGAVKEALGILDGFDEEKAGAPAAVRARATQLRALALSLAGEHARAQALLQQVAADVETSGILGGILKRRWIETERRSWLEASYGTYKSAHDTTPDPYLAVNVAALALQLGRPDEARVEAERTLALVLEKGSPTYWDVASRAEAFLILGRLDEAQVDYRQAALACAGSREIAVMRRQARLNLAKLGRDPHALDADLVPGAVACVLSAPLEAGFWTSARMVVMRKQLDALVRKRGVVFGFGSAARGPDLLFADVLRERRATATVLVPGPRPAFEEAFVGPAWRPFLARVPNDRIVVLAAAPGEPDARFDACDGALTRAALEMGARLDEPPILIVYPPPPGVADVRQVRPTMESWNARGGGDVVELTIA